MGMIGKVKTLGWFAVRPELWGQAAYLVQRKFQRNADSPALRARATQWCKDQAVPAADVMTGLGGKLDAFETAIGADSLAAARARAASCPTKMGGEGHLGLLYSCAELTQALRVLETGVAYGWSSYAILRSLQNRPGAHLASTDMPYVKLNLEDYVGVVVPDELRQQWTLIRQADRQGLPKALAQLGRLDLCHYDSDKSYQGRMWAYPILWDSLRSGGILISDDIQDNAGFKDFVKTISAEWYVAEHLGKYVGVIRKP